MEESVALRIKVRTPMNIDFFSFPSKLILFVVFMQPTRKF
jgi:hypothetical protein